jgi:hypothetical protein
LLSEPMGLVMRTQNVCSPWDDDWLSPMGPSQPPMNMVVLINRSPSHKRARTIPQDIIADDLVGLAQVGKFSCAKCRQFQIPQERLLSKPYYKT